MTPAFQLRFRMTPSHHRLQQGILLSLVVVNLALGWRVWQANQSLTQALSQRETLTQEARQAQHRQLENTDPKQLRSAMQVRQSVPWELLLDTLARLTPPSLQILDITPNPEASTLDLTVQGRSLEAVTPYMRALSGSGVLANVYLVEQEQAEADASPAYGDSTISRWNFVLRGEWLTAGRNAASTDPAAGGAQ